MKLMLQFKRYNFDRWSKSSNGSKKIISSMKVTEECFSKVKKDCFKFIKSQETSLKSLVIKMGC